MSHEELPDTARQLQAYWQRSLPAGPQPGAARPDAARPDAARPDAARPDAARPDAARLFDQVLAAWSEPQRAYHTPQHLLECLKLLDAWCGARDWPKVLALALFFHDLVYDPRRSDNEDRSAERARELLPRVNVKGEQLSAIVALIDITRHAATPRTEDEKLVVDIDLAILGATPERYAQYCSQVRQEYAHVPDALFTRGRLAVLEGFVHARPALYHTARGRRAFGAAAARNLTAEIGALRAALGDAGQAGPEAAAKPQGSAPA